MMSLLFAVFVNFVDGAECHILNVMSYYEAYSIVNISVIYKVLYYTFVTD